MPSLHKKFFYSFDLFSAVPSLRARSQSDISSICGGVTSLIVMIAFIYLFITDMTDLANYGQISSTETTTIQKKTTNNLTNMVFAIGLQNIDLSETKDIFSIRAVRIQHYESNHTIEDLELVLCSREMWADLGQYNESEFEDHKMGKLLCFSDSSKITIRGIKRQDLFSSIKFYISECSDEGNGGNETNCKSKGEINEYLSELKQSQKYVVAKFLYLNTGFNSRSQEPLVKYVDSRIWLTFSRAQGVEAFVQVGNFQIKTDKSFLPFQEIQTITGNYLVDYSAASFDRAKLTVFVQIQVTMSTHKIYIQRSFGKIDDRLSYIGGLFEIVIIFLSFFLGSYAVYRYQIMMSEKIYSGGNNKPKDENFNFFRYIKYVIFDWIKTFGCNSPRWQDCEKIEEAREEVNEQMDVEMLLRRISHLQRSQRLLMNEREEKILYLQLPNTLDQNRKNRKYFKFYDHLVQNDSPRIIKDICSSKEDDMKTINLNSEEFRSEREDPIPECFESSIDVLDLALKRTEKYIQYDEDLELQRQDEEIEEQMRRAYFSLEEEMRQEVQKTIPLNILRRLKKKQDDHEKLLRPEEIVPQIIKVAQRKD